MMPAMASRALPLLALVFSFGLADRAAASPSYSDVVKRTFDMECAPSCLLCHTKEQGGFATANTKLGITLRRELDAECCNDQQLAGILEELAQAAFDSDGDGTSDADELRAFRDPNEVDSADAPSELTCRPSSASGCATLVQPGTPRLLWSAGGLLLLAVWSLRRYQRRA